MKIYKKLLKKIFVTSRELLVRKSLLDNIPYNYKKVLVIGAGEDPYRFLLSGSSVHICLDVENNEGTTNVVGDAHDLPFVNGYFDVVVLIEVLEHLHDPKLCIQEVLRVLDNHGTLILSVPFMFHQHNHPSDFQRFTELGLRRLLKEFGSLYLESQGGRLHVISDLITTSFYPLKIMIPFRILNWLIVFLKVNSSTSPSGFFVMAAKDKGGLK